MPTPRKKEAEPLEITAISRAKAEIYILGESPLIMNRMSEKARRELLLPRQGRLNAAAKAANLKHDPYAEFRASAYRIREADAPTLLGILPTAFKGAARTAALDIPGAAKSAIGRQLYVYGNLVPIYGEPQILCSVVRQAGIEHTPDIRTRCIVPNWACKLSVSYATPLLKPNAVANLIAAAGITSGVGDWRTEKGSGNFGAFRIVSQDDPQWKAIVETGGRAVQIAAMLTPATFDDETDELLSWFLPEAKKRGFEVAEPGQEAA
jgi:hypothetical protein